jgi:hypothetical protein
MTIPPEWQGRFAPRDPLRQPKPQGNPLKPRTSVPDPKKPHRRQPHHTPRGGR